MSAAKPPWFVVIGASIMRRRRLMRAPIWIFKARAGVVFGRRLLMLEHIGRKSGLRRYVVLEVIDHPAEDRYVVASGFGRKAQWFRNVTANPQIRVCVGRRTSAPATARVMTQREADCALAEYAGKHPRGWERLKPVLERTLGGPISASDTPLPIVELRLN